MALSSPFSIHLQNVWLTWVFWLAFITVTVLSGAIIGVVFAFVVASVGAFLYRKYVNRLLPVPRKTAVLITGCSSGIGQDAALRLASEGFLVLATVRKQEDADILKKKAGNSQLFPILCDVTKAADLAAALETVKRRLAQDRRQLLGLVCNAGYCELGPLELATPDTFRSQYETNVVGTVACVQTFLPLLREFAASSPQHRARIVLVSSVAGRLSVPGTGVYASSKHAVEAIGDSLRMELSKWGIAVSILEPGSVQSDFYAVAVASMQRSLDGASQRLQHEQLPAGQAVLDSYYSTFTKVQAGLKRIPYASVEETSDAIQCALLDSQPLSRYAAGWTSLPMFPLLSLPTELLDLILGRDWR
jgi:NAD(P)-dependent dehydrogenase (short-subunit alcohol dehydrogenase family)